MALGRGEWPWGEGEWPWGEGGVTYDIGILCTAGLGGMFSQEYLTC